MKGIIRAVCVSEQKGTLKRNVGEAELKEQHGLVGDAHAGNWHRQVSLLAKEKVEEFSQKGIRLEAGAFGENLLVEGIDLRALPVGTRIAGGEWILKVSQIGKECHTSCAIRNQVGDCIMPREGIFAEVIQGGRVYSGEEIVVMPEREDAPLTAAVITLSDKGAAKQREDKSGPLCEKRLKEQGYEVVEALLLPDDPQLLKKELIRLSDQRQVALILTNGGTGFSPRDITPEATLEIAERVAPGIAEAIRAGSMQITKRAMLSRGVSVIRGKTLIVNLPGSPKAVEESLDFVLDTLEHGIRILRQKEQECGRS